MGIVWSCFTHEVTKAERNLRNLPRATVERGELGSGPRSLAPEPQHLANRTNEKLRDD